MIGWRRASFWVHLVEHWTILVCLHVAKLSTVTAFALCQGGIRMGIIYQQDIHCIMILTIAPSFLPRIRPNTGFSAREAFLFNCLCRRLSALRLSLASWSWIRFFIRAFFSMSSVGSKVSVLNDWLGDAGGRMIDLKKRDCTL